MNHKHRKVIHSLFAHPVSANIEIREIEAALGELGAEIGHSGHGRLTFTLNGHVHSVHGTGHTLSKDDVMSVRKFLETCGFAEDQFPV
jgi:hypothetical protein